MMSPTWSMRPLILATLAALAGCGTDRAQDAAPDPATGPAASRMLLDFKGSSAVAGWETMNDSIVGGTSQGAIKSTASGTAVFEGTITQERGGFVMIHCPNGAYDLRGFTGLEVRLRGDGKRYKLLVKTNPENNGFQYLADLWTQDGVWQTMRIAFGAFKPNFLGNNLLIGRPIDPANVVSMGFVVANYQQGPFRLEMESVKAYP